MWGTRLGFSKPLPRLLIYVARACRLAVAAGLAATIARTLSGSTPQSR